MNIDLVAIPEEMTSRLQVLDVVIHKHFKNHLKQLNSEFLLAGSCVMTATKNVKKVSVAVSQDLMTVDLSRNYKVLYMEHNE